MICLTQITAIINNTFHCLVTFKNLPTLLLKEQKMTQKSSVHYYEDGDILVTVQDVKLILDNLLEYKKEADFQLITTDTRCALMEKYLDFALAISSFQELKYQYDYQHACEKNPHLYTVCNNKQKTTMLYEEFFSS